LHQLVQYGLKIRLAIVDAYLDNLLAMPIILTLLKAERRYLFKRGVAYRLSLLEVLLATSYVSIISEWVFPYFSKRFVFDLLDFLFFFIGSLIYLWAEQRGPTAKSPNA